MNKYQTQGKVYAIRSHQTEDIYIGSTCDTLPKRFYGHKAQFKRYRDGKGHYYTSFKMLEFDDAYIELFENCPCNDKNELTRREGELIRSNPNCVNKNIAGQTQKQWRQVNAEHIKEYRNQYRQDNAEIIKEKRNQYQQDNAEALKAYYKQYQQANAEHIKKRMNQKHICPCGGKYNKSHEARHFRTKKHQKYLETH